MTFETFWSIYPRRLNKATAVKAYNTALKKGATHEQLARGAEEFRAYVERNAIANQFVCHPSTWLHQERWLNDYRSDDHTTERNANSPASRTWSKLSAAHQVFEKKKAQMGCTNGVVENDF